MKRRPIYKQDPGIVDVGQALLDYRNLASREFYAKYPDAYNALSPAPDAVEERDILNWMIDELEWALDDSDGPTTGADNGC